VKSKEMQKECSCHICSSNLLKVAKGYERLPQVTSDCKLWKPGVRLSVCSDCGLVQKITDHAWKKDTDIIYSDYTLYHQAKGVEQAVFDSRSGKIFRRSERVLDYVIMKISLPGIGKYLDLGCGSGNTLRYFSSLFPLWSLSGLDLNRKYKRSVEKISNRVKFYSGPAQKIPGRFDLITMFHVLEHVVDPVSFLENVRSKLSSKGFLIIDVPDYRQNPFDLFVTDHCIHFSKETITEALNMSGFRIEDINPGLIPKETVVIAKKGNTGKQRTRQARVGFKNTDYGCIVDYINWTESFLGKARSASANKNFGIFGTSIIATWLKAGLGSRIKFFVDEDPGRYGRTYMGLPVYQPKDIPQNSSIFLALPWNIAKELKMRLRRKGIKYYLPPALRA